MPPPLVMARSACTAARITSAMKLPKFDSCWRTVELRASRAAVVSPTTTSSSLLNWSVWRWIRLAIAGSAGIWSVMVMSSCLALRDPSRAKRVTPSHFASGPALAINRAPPRPVRAAPGLGDQPAPPRRRQRVVFVPADDQVDLRHLAQQFLILLHAHVGEGDDYPRPVAAQDRDDRFGHGHRVAEGSRAGGGGGGGLLRQQPDDADGDATDIEDQPRAGAGERPQARSERVAGHPGEAGLADAPDQFRRAAIH